MSVGRICIREVDTAEPSESVQTIARRMNDRNVGTLVVIDDECRPTGIVTDRDLVVEVLARGRDSVQTTVGDVMTLGPRTVDENTPIEMALAAMRAGPYRRLPVVDRSGKLVGLVSVDDVLGLLAEELSEIGTLVRREGPECLATK
jgi:CBS domain-containing protein